MNISLDFNYWSIGKMASAAQTSKSTIYRFIHSGQLPAYKLGGRIVVRTTDAENFLRNLPAVVVDSRGHLVAAIANQAAVEVTHG